MNTADPSKHSVRIHLDRQAHESPNPTTGEALYALGAVPEHHELFREASGDREDEPVPRVFYPEHTASRPSPSPATGTPSVRVKV